ncbi:MAG: 2-phospho-L-lactate transferase [Actinomycetes bacterium]
MICVLAGGVGAARFLHGLLEVVDASEVTVVVNVGDDSVLHGLTVCPDTDTILYTLGGSVNPETGWGLVGETWAAMSSLRRHAAANGIAADDPVAGEAAGWFSLGDQDLGTHLYRSSRLAAGATLTQVTAELARSVGLDLRLLPVTDDPLRTRVTTVDGRDLAFQEYFVREQHAVAVADVRFVGAEAAQPAPGVLEAIASADAVIVAPSNPVVSIGPLLAVPGVRDAVAAARGRVAAVSPIVGGAALKGPADRLLRELGHEATVTGVARWYAPLASVLVVDEVDRAAVPEVEAEGVRAVVTDTIMSRPGVGAALARAAVGAVGVRLGGGS